MKSLLNNEPDRAREHFEKSVATNQHRLTAFTLARAELARLAHQTKSAPAAASTGSPQL